MSLNARQNHHHEGTFAEGTAHPESYADEDHVGTFAQGTERDLSA